MDLDIEIFLREKALEYIRRSWCAVYLILDETALEAGTLNILAYFTLSHKSMIPHTSKTNIRTVTGGFSSAESLHFVLIGQLGKHIETLPDGSYKKAAISVVEILNYAFEIIEESNELIPCRCVLIECSSEPKVQQLYKDYGFKFLQQDENLFQYYKPL